MNTYFNECATLEEAKQLYKKLARENHPDMGGDLRTMQEINAAYSDFLQNFAKREAYSRQEQAHTANRKSAADFHDMDEIGEQLRTMINFALNLEGVEVELMGLWVWLTGNTKAHKDAFKAWNETSPLKWRWMHKKQAWVFAGVPSFNRQEKTLDQIRSTYGSQVFTRSNYSQRQEDQATANAGALHG